jgi:hypothetical protein
MALAARKSNAILLRPIWLIFVQLVEQYLYFAISLADAWRN